MEKSDSAYSEEELKKLRASKRAFAVEAIAGALRVLGGHEVLSKIIAEGANQFRLDIRGEYPGIGGFETGMSLSWNHSDKSNEQTAFFTFPARTTWNAGKKVIRTEPVLEDTSTNTLGITAALLKQAVQNLSDLRRNPEGAAGVHREHNIAARADILAFRKQLTKELLCLCVDLGFSPEDVVRDLLVDSGELAEALAIHQNNRAAKADVPI